MFDQKQVQEFKEVKWLFLNMRFLSEFFIHFKAFNLMDQDRDGTVSMDDLKEVYASLGNLFFSISFYLD